MDFEKKAPVGKTEAPQGPDFAGSMYNRRNQYSTVYDQGFYKQKDLSGKSEIAAKRGLAGAGEQLMTQYQAQEAQRWTPFGQFNAEGAVGKVTSASIYGGFFKK